MHHNPPQHSVVYTISLICTHTCIDVDVLVFMRLCNALREYYVYHGIYIRISSVQLYNYCTIKLKFFVVYTISIIPTDTIMCVCRCVGVYVFM